jgi:hypothetical protein
MRWVVVYTVTVDLNHHKWSYAPLAAMCFLLLVPPVVVWDFGLEVIENSHLYCNNFHYNYPIHLVLLL